MSQQTQERAVTRRALLQGTAAGVAAAGATGTALAAGGDGGPGNAELTGPAETTDGGGPVQQTTPGDGGNESDGETTDGEDADSEPTAATGTAAATLVAMLVLGFLSPVVFILLIRRRMGGSSEP